jgi:dihydrofolate reductase
MTPHTTEGRRVVGNISLSLDGRFNGPGGDDDMSWVVPHAVTDTSRDYAVRMTGSATTALLGRKNYEGFGGYWPVVAKDDHAEPRDRTLAQWLDSVEKIVFSKTLTDAPWANSRIAESDPATVVRRLRTQPGGDIIVLNSGSVINALLEAGELDRLVINLCPAVAGGGARFFADGLPASTWTLAEVSRSESGAIYLTYDRARNDS